MEHLRGYFHISVFRRKMEKLWIIVLLMLRYFVSFFCCPLLFRLTFSDGVKVNKSFFCRNELFANKIDMAMKKGSIQGKKKCLDQIWMYWILSLGTHCEIFLFNLLSYRYLWHHTRTIMKEIKISYKMKMLLFILTARRKCLSFISRKSIDHQISNNAIILSFNNSFK